MSPAALQVPLGVPLGPGESGGPAWEEVHAPEGRTGEEKSAPDDPWGDAPEEALPHVQCTTSYFHLSEAPDALGYALVLAGFSDGAVHVYSIDVVREDVPETSTRPRSLVSTPHSPTHPDFSVWEHGGKAAASTAHTDMTPASPQHDSTNASSSEASTKVSRANARATTYDAPGAESLLEAQYHASDAPHVIAHGGSDVRPRTHEHAHRHAAPYPSFLEPHASDATFPEPLSPRTYRSAEVQPVQSHFDGVPRLVRSLYTPDASAVVAVAVDDRPDDPLAAQLLVHQASGRVTAWALPALSFLATVQLRVMQHPSRDEDHDVQFLFERQATELGAPLLQPVEAYMHMARLQPCTDPGLEVHPVDVAGDASEAPPPPPMFWAQYRAWPSRVFVLRLDAVRSAFRVCAILQTPDAAAARRTLRLCLGAQPALQLIAADDALHVCTYALEDLAGFYQGLPMPAHGAAPTEAGAPASGASAQTAARLSLRHLSLLLPAWTMPKHAPSVTHETSRDVLWTPTHESRPVRELGGDGGAPVAVTTVGDQCAVALPSALLLVDLGGAGASTRSVALPSRPVRVYTMHATRTIGVVCEVRRRLTQYHHVLVHLGADRGLDHEVETHARDATALAVPVAGELLSLARGARAAAARGGARPPFSALLPLSLTRVIVAQAPHAGCGAGLLSAPLLSLFSGDARPAAQPLPWDAPLTLLQQVANPRTGTRHILGGTQAGDIGVWNVGTLQLEAAWSWFAAPIQCVVPLLGVSPVSRLYGCVLCVATDGTSALLALDDLRLVQMFPGCGAPLVQIAARGHELLLAYGERRARIWSLATQELVRSTTAEQLWMLVAKADAAGEAWLRLPVPPAPRSAPGRVDKSAQSGMLSACSAVADGAVPIVLADVRKAVEVACKTLRAAFDVASLVPVLDALTRPYAHGEPAATHVPLADDTHAGKLLGTLRPLLAVFLPSDLDSVFAQLRNAAYGGHAPPTALTPASLGLPGFVSAAAGPDAALSAARFSTDAPTSAHHLLALVALVLVASPVPALQPACRAALDALLTPAFVRAAVAPRTWVPPSLAVLAQFVLDENEVLRTSAFLLFRQYMAEARDEELDVLVATYAPCLQDLAADEAPHALLTLGLVASERYAYFSPTLLKHVSVGVARCLHAPITDVGGAQRAYIALELCCHGCGVWQHYVDAVALVRGIFGIATQPEDVAPALKLSGLSLRGLARRATLELAARHSALFMSTLAMDILHATSVEQSQVTLRLVAFMIRQKPLALYPSLPRLVEAVVKSLDPTAGATRSAIAKSATLMINELVQTYPTIAFHGATQRLAVGTHEGPVVLYDLKTATRLYVLDGHKHPVTACSFSPDGRRFLSMSLADECVLIWRLSTGLMDFLVPSAMSRFAGTHGQAEADRVLHFHLGTAGA